VIITVGPSCQSVDALCALLNAGATCARIDLTWAPIEYHRLSLQNLQEAMRRTKRLCAVMLDSLGREIMVRRAYGVDESGWPGIFDRLEIAAGARITMTADPDAVCTASVFPVTYPKFTEMCRVGDSIFVGRYLVTGADESSLFLEVVAVEGGEVVCEAKNGAVLDGLLTIFHQERSATALSNLQNDLPALTDFDRQAVQVLAAEFEVDFLSLSYCRSVEDVDEAREFLDSIGCEATKLVAKVETRQALLNFRSIAYAADGVVVSRGNLGLDVQPEKMAMVQKAMCTACAILGKPAIITRVCDSMIGTPRPTRAEATDIANAGAFGFGCRACLAALWFARCCALLHFTIHLPPDSILTLPSPPAAAQRAVLDGVDCILLGAETYRGKYGLETVATVAAICKEAEAVFDHSNHFEHLTIESEYALAAAESSAAAAPEDGGASDGEGGGAPAPRGRLGRSPSQTSLMGSEAGMAQAFSSATLSALGAGGPARTLSAMSGDLAAAAAPPPPRAPASKTAKLESVAAAAVKTADKVGATLIVVVTHTGRTASMVAKYRPRQPIMTLVVPYLKRRGLSWVLEGRAAARQSQVTFGLMPVLAAPAASSGEGLVDEAVQLAIRNRVVRANDHVVVVSRSAADEFIVKVVTVDSGGGGIAQIRPKSLLDMLRAAGQTIGEDGDEGGDALLDGAALVPASSGNGGAH
jgi:pyruvate kinase